MKRSIAILSASLLLSACAPQVDRCTSDPNLPDCRAQSAVANATISAIEMERAAVNREATRQAKAAEQLAVAQQTQAAASANATQIAVAAFATKTAAEITAQKTKSALEINAMIQQGVVSATISAITIDTARVKSSIELSTTQLVGKSEVDRNRAEAETSSTRALLWLGLVVFCIGLVGISIAWSIKRVGSAVANFAEVRSGIVKFGDHIFYLSPGPDGSKHIKDLTGMLSDGGRSDEVDTFLDELDVPEPQKLAARLQVKKLRAAVDIAGHLNAWPDVEETGEEQASLPAGTQNYTGPYYQIVAPEKRPELITGITRAEEVLDAEWHRLETSA